MKSKIIVGSLLSGVIILVGGGYVLINQQARKIAEEELSKASPQIKSIFRDIAEPSDGCRKTDI